MPEEPRPDEVDDLMRQLGVDPQKVPRSPAAAEPHTAPSSQPAAGGCGPGGASPAQEPAAGGLGFLGDVNVRLKVELGRTRLSVQDVLGLGSGSVVPLENLTTDPVGVYVNDRLVARGEIIVVNDNFAVRITEVVPPPAPEGKLAPPGP